MKPSLVSESPDTLAETNPAFCALVLAAFIKAYERTSNHPLPITLLPLALPILISGDLEDSFTNLRDDSGITRWILRTPQLIFRLGERVQTGLEITRNALQYALHYGVLEINERAYIRCVYSANAENQLSKIKFARMAANARRLGVWFGNAPSDATIYNLLGLEV